MIHLYSKFHEYLWVAKKTIDIWYKQIYPWLVVKMNYESKTLLYTLYILYSALIWLTLAACNFFLIFFQLSFRICFIEVLLLQWTCELTCNKSVKIKLKISKKKEKFQLFNKYWRQNENKTKENELNFKQQRLYRTIHFGTYVCICEMDLNTSNKH